MGKTLDQQLETPEFDKQNAKDVRDWRNYVPTRLQERWEQLGMEARLAIFIMADWAAQQREKWAGQDGKDHIYSGP